MPPVNAFTAEVLVSINFSKFNDTPCTENVKNDGVNERNGLKEIGMIN